MKNIMMIFHKQIDQIISRQFVLVMIVGVYFMLPGNVNAQPDLKTGVLIRNTTLIDGTGSAAQVGVDLLLRDNKIVAIGYDLKKPEQATILDGTGKYVIPGLIDTHTHLDFQIVSQLSPEEKQAIVNHNPLAFLYNGVTTVLNVSSNAEWIWRMRENQRAGKLTAPRIYALGHSFTAVDGWGSRHGGAFADTSLARKQALDYVAADTDGFKIIIEDGLGEGSGTYSEISEEVLQSIVGVSNENKVPLYIHAIGLPEYRRAIKLKPRAILHGLEDSIPAGDSLIEDLVTNQIAVVPTLSLFRSFLGADPQAGKGLDSPVLEATTPEFLLKKMRSVDFMKSESRIFTKVARMEVYEWVKNRNLIFCDNVKKMHSNGVKIAVGTDAGGTVGFNFQGYNTPWEVKILTECGLTPMEALVAATRNGAEVIGIADQLGTVEPGKLADLLILSANPLENIENIRQIELIILNGQVHSRNEFAYTE